MMFLTFFATRRDYNKLINTDQSICLNRGFGTTPMDPPFIVTDWQIIGSQCCNMSNPPS